MGIRQRGKPSKTRPSLPVGGAAGMVSRERTSPRALSLVILLATLPYLNTFPNAFVFDDTVVIVEDVRIRSLRNLPTLLTAGYWAPNPTGGRLLRPLVTVSYALNYSLGGLHPFGYHLVNLLAHAGVSLAVYRLALRLFRHREGALVAAAVFAVHPLHTEAVTGIVGRAELFVAGAFLLAWLWYLEGQRRPRYLVASCGAFALALFSKENALTFPGVLILSDLYVARDRQGQEPLADARGSQGPGLVRRYAGYLVVLIGWIVLWGAAIGRGPHRQPPLLDNPLAHVGPQARLLTALEVAGRYLWLMVWPQYLSPDYSYNQIPIVTSFGEPRVLLAGVAWGALIGAACWSYRGARRAFLCVGFTLVTFLTGSNLLIPIGTVMGERLFYLPSVGVCLFAGVAWQRIVERPQGTASSIRIRRLGRRLLVAIVIVLAARTVLRNSDWRTEETLFRSAARAAPNSAKVRSNLAGIYLQRGLTDSALRELQTSIAILPTPTAHRNLGTLYLRTGEPQRAIEEYRRALDLDPREAGAYASLGYALLNQGAPGEAVAALQRAIALNSGLADAHYTLGRARAIQGRWSEAIAAYQEARRLKPGFAEASYALGLALDASEQYAAAAQTFEETLRLRPEMRTAHRRLGELYRDRLGNPEKARQHLQKAEEAEEPSGRGSVSKAGHGGSTGLPVPAHGQ